MEQNKKILVLIIIYSFLFFSLNIFAQKDSLISNSFTEIIPNHTELQIIHSKIIDDDYYLYIKLPRGYHESEKTYPVIYLLDGDIAFTMAWSMVRYLQYGKHLPDVIIVGIGYGSLLSSEEENMRERDFTISKLSDKKMTGGGKQFLKFLRTELIPFIDSIYRTTPGDRVINGYSLSGLFVLYAFLNENELFNGYIAGSPYISLDKVYLEKLVKESANNLKISEAKLFISFGELEDEDNYGKPINDIVGNLSQIGFEMKNIDLRIFEGGTHFTCPSEAMVYGLKFVFE